MVEEIDGAEAMRRIVESPRDADSNVDQLDPLQLEAGQAVRVAPIDIGFSGVQEGKLVRLDARQVAVETTAKNGETVTVHYLRWNFRITPLA
jgi:hypothetical protein